MPQVVPQSDSLRKVFVKGKRAGKRTCYLHHGESMRKAGAVMVAFGREKHLRFVF